MKMTPERIRDMEDRRSDLVKRINEMNGELRELDYGLSVAQAEVEGMPSETGWYLDSAGQIAHRDVAGIWDDGWGNFGPDYGHFSPPMTRLWTLDQVVNEFGVDLSRENERPES